MFHLNKSGYSVWRQRLLALVIICATAIGGAYLLNASHATSITAASDIGTAYAVNTQSATAQVANIATGVQGMDANSQYTQDCIADRLSVTCYQDFLNAINSARTVLDPGVAPMNINLASLMAMNPAQQLLTLTNVERVQRGLTPYTALTNQLNSWAMTGAQNSTDPTQANSTLTGGAFIMASESNWGGSNYFNPLVVDYFWMYNDSGSNWGHRNNILQRYSDKCPSTDNFYMGGAYAYLPGARLPYSYTEIMTGACGPAPTDATYTWQQALSSGVYTPPTSPCMGSTLYADQRLPYGQCLLSPSGQYKLNFQQTTVNSTGFVSSGTALQIINTSTGKQVWTTNCGGTDGYLTMQSDGNLVEFAGGTSCWKTGTDRLGGTQVVIQDDGNLAIQTAIGTPVWSRLTGIVVDPPSTLYAGHRLYPGQELFSPSNQYRLIMQGDGNLVVYDSHNQATWATNTNGKRTGDLSMQTDGNLVLYDVWGNPLWTASTRGMGGTHLVMQDDGNLVLYTAYNQVVWSSYAGRIPFPAHLNIGQKLYPGQQLLSPKHQYHLVLQPDGNLVVYNANNQAIWYSGTYGQPVANLSMQGDSNLVLYNAAGNAVWNTNTRGMGGNYLSLQDDGNLVVYTTFNQATWSRSTGVLPFPAHLNMGQNLYPGQQLLSPAHQYRVVLQGDGNLVVYNAVNQPVWSSHTNGIVPGHLAMQGDSNLVLYNSSGGVAWTATTQGMGGNYLSMQDDGNLVVYTVFNQAVWSSVTGRISFPDRIYSGQRLYPGQQLLAPQHHYRLVLQGDGNLVVYNQNNQPTWSSGTAGQVPANLSMQGDGNLVLYNTSGIAVWDPSTQKLGGTQVHIQDDGNLVIYTNTNAAVWSIFTGRLY